MIIWVKNDFNTGHEQFSQFPFVLLIVEYIAKKDKNA